MIKLTGFIKGRFTGENIPLIDSLITFCADKNTPSLLYLFLSLEKAFDPLEWPFVRKELAKLCFGQSLILGENVFYSGAESCVLNNGWAANFFNLSRGVRQGCPLSLYLLVISAEILANAFRANPNIKGVLFQKRPKISYASMLMTPL